MFQLSGFYYALKSPARHSPRPVSCGIWTSSGSAGYGGGRGGRGLGFRGLGIGGLEGLGFRVQGLGIGGLGFRAGWFLVLVVGFGIAVGPGSPKSRALFNS